MLTVEQTISVVGSGVLMLALGERIKERGGGRDEERGRTREGKNERFEF